eukprot:CAMPEP_0116099928 /NCGR_PEP_ID=MMETSP0327-20121206/12026_1 /TAXON_ID=44447 /ORGANISM="Pseudo-nitzschia delicatissima, Strain B596" /LENGTH=321 /DNA_ID=CAMNT_0003591831 /DNA_START=26 /DNA_END=991 /DNA_ORIENTATION=-
MVDQSTEITNTIIDRTLSEVGEQIEQLKRHADYDATQRHPAIIVLSLIIGTLFLGCVYLLSQNHVNSERRALAEAERNRIAERIAEETAEIDKMETQRSKISKIIDGYAIHLTNMTSALSPTSRQTTPIVLPDKSDSKKASSQIPDGSDEHDVPIETVTISNHSSEDDLQDIEKSTDNIEDKDESISGHEQDPACDTLRPTLTIDASDQNAVKIPSSSSITSTIDRAQLREAVTDNPCAICLEPFKAGDDIVHCSNTALQRPHIFHQACSLDYVVSHPDGVKAPCPCCRQLLLPSEEQQRKWECVRCSYGSALTLPELGEP